MHLSGIFIYPIKSLAGISLQIAQLSDRGLALDRRWMLVTPDGTFLTQRRFPEMALLEVNLASGGLEIRDKRKRFPSIILPLNPHTRERMQVQVWDSVCEAQVVDLNADAWFSEALGIRCRLVYMPDETHRKVNPKRVQNGEIVSFADGYPYLIIGQASLDLLNEKMPQALPMNRFRPNFVFTGGQANEEDTWQTFRIGPVTFHGVKPCVRCEIPTIDQETAARGKEPLKTLATYRRVGNEVIFGQNLVHKGTGSISVGDEIEVLSRKEPELT